MAAAVLDPSDSFDENRGGGLFFGERSDKSHDFFLLGEEESGEPIA